MIEFGKTLREAREAKGLSVAQLADQTHIMHQIAEGLENEDFSRIVAPIYGRGFVKLYCECVGLEPKPYVDEFMEIYNGNRPSAIRTRAVPAAVEAVTPSAPAPATDLFEATPPVGKAMPPPPPAPSGSRFATPLPEDRAPVFSRDFFEKIGERLPPNIWRLLTLGLTLTAVLLLAILGIRAVYHAATTVPADVKTEEVGNPAKPAASETPSVPPAAKPAAPRKPAAVPALYID